MKSQIITLISLFTAAIAFLELYFNGKLARLFFGDMAERDFEDIPLPSEEREATQPAQKSSPRNGKRRFPLARQLSLLFKRSILRWVYRSLVLCERMLSGARTRTEYSGSGENHYL